jgi:AraC-like DNA-binding protein
MLTSFNHINAQNVRFAIKVEGCGDDWVTLDMGENIFRIFNLDKGEYKVMLKATDENGLWGDAKEVAIINRLPAWWETWWAYTIYGLMTAGAIAGLFILYRYVSKKREQFDNMLRQQSIINEMQKSSNNSHIRQEVKEENDNATRSEINKQKRCELTEKAIAAVKANLDNEDYTVDMLANELCMSRVNLYRKMITICGQTPSEFMKTLRMEEAYRLLQSTDLPINIVAGKCGFTSSSYFAKCFKTRYGILPTDVRR